MNIRFEEFKERVRSAKRLVFLGGAGVSTASGIPDFRSPNGLYHIKSKYGVSYERMLSHSYYESQPERFYEFYWESMVNEAAKPNRAHLALSEYEQKGHYVAILTQNIDGLHTEAGSSRVYELHGSVKRYACEECGRHYALDEINHFGVPHCRVCGGRLKPLVTLYEEPLDEETLAGALLELKYGSFLIVGGTSLNVYPAAGLIHEFQGPSLLINLEETPLDAYFQYVIHDDVGKVLDALLLG